MGIAESIKHRWRGARDHIVPDRLKPEPGKAARAPFSPYQRDLPPRMRPVSPPPGTQAPMPAAWHGALAPLGAAANAFPSLLPTAPSTLVAQSYASQSVPHRYYVSLTWVDPDVVGTHRPGTSAPFFIGPIQACLKRLVHHRTCATQLSYTYELRLLFPELDIAPETTEIRRGKVVHSNTVIVRYRRDGGDLTEPNPHPMPARGITPHPYEADDPDGARLYGRGDNDLQRLRTGHGVQLIKTRWWRDASPTDPVPAGIRLPPHELYLEGLPLEANHGLLRLDLSQHFHLQAVVQIQAPHVPTRDLLA